MNLGGKLDICWRDDFFFAHPSRAALGFKLFSNEAVRVKSLLTPGPDDSPIKTKKNIRKEVWPNQTIARGSLLN